MNNPQFTPKEQLDRIEEMVFKARLNFEENGFAFIFWGITISLASFSQVALIHLGKAAISWYPYLIMPLAGVFTFLYYAKKQPVEKNPIDTIYSKLWMIISLNIMLLSFGFHAFLGKALIAIILILVGIATTVSASFIRSQLLLISGLLLQLGGYIAFIIPLKHQPMLMGILALIAILAPGIILSLKHRKKDVQKA